MVGQRTLNPFILVRIQVRQQTKLASNNCIKLYLFRFGIELLICYTAVSMSENKKTIERYIDGFNKSDHAQILSCLTDDVVWEMPGIFHHEGKEAFDSEIENPAFEGKPVVVITRLTEENNVVVAEGTVKGKKKDGESFNAVFCDVFEMQNTRIKRLIGYIAMINQT